MSNTLSFTFKFYIKYILHFHIKFYFPDMYNGYFQEVVPGFDGVMKYYSTHVELRKIPQQPIKKRKIPFN